MIPPPTPWDLYRPGSFRLAGFGGAALILRSGVASSDGPTLTIDIGFLTPEDYVWFMRRPMAPGTSERLAGFFYACAEHENPEMTVTPVDDPLSGLEVRAVASTAEQVVLEIGVDDDDDGSGVNFETTRVALIQAAGEVRVLEAAVGELPGPPSGIGW